MIGKGTTIVALAKFDRDFRIPSSFSWTGYLEGLHIGAHTAGIGVPMSRIPRSDVVCMHERNGVLTVRISPSRILLRRWSRLLTLESCSHRTFRSSAARTRADPLSMSSSAGLSSMGVLPVPASCAPVSSSAGIGRDSQFDSRWLTRAPAIISADLACLAVCASEILQAGSSCSFVVPAWTSQQMRSKFSL